ncbi:hypothetical protein O5D80_007503 [Batrachochytrium dendrobatidis]|nr:hypothetical protein O5D80_007503 [Batrachochytrium dendrobatidis]
MKFISIIVMSLLSATVSAVVIDRSSTSESETVEDCSTKMQQHTGICASTGTEQQSTGTSHDVAQSTTNHDDSGNSAEQFNELPSSSQSDQNHDEESLESYVPENQQTVTATLEKLDELEMIMKELDMRIPTKIGNGYPHEMDEAYVRTLLDYDSKGLDVPDVLKEDQLKALLGSEWERHMLKLEPIEEASIRVVSEPTPQLKSILKSGPTSKSHGSKHGHSRKHQEKSNHDTGSRKAKVHFETLTRKVFKKKLFEGKYKTTITDISQNEESVGETNPGYATDKNDQTKNNRGATKSRSNKSKTDDDDEIQPTQSTRDDDESQPTQPTQSTRNEEESQPTQPTQPTQSTSNEEESQPTQPTQSTSDDDEIQPTQSTRDDDESQPTQPTQSTSNKSKGRSVLSILKDMFKFKIVKPELPKLKVYSIKMFGH